MFLSGGGCKFTVSSAAWQLGVTTAALTQWRQKGGGEHMHAVHVPAKPTAVGLTLFLRCSTLAGRAEPGTVLP